VPFEPCTEPDLPAIKYPSNAEAPADTVPQDSKACSVLNGAGNQIGFGPILVTVGARLGQAGLDGTGGLVGVLIFSVDPGSNWHDKHYTKTLVTDHGQKRDKRPNFRPQIFGLFLGSKSAAALVATRDKRIA